MVSASKAPKRSMDLCTGPFFRKILLYSIPIILTGLLQLLFNAADLVVVGRFGRPNAISAVGVTGALINLLVNLFMGLSVGAGVFVAQGIGARDKQMVHRTVHTAIPSAAIAGAVLTVVGILLAPEILVLMDTDAAILPDASIYLQIYFAGSIPILLYNFGASILRAAGDTRSPLIFLSVAGVLNIFLNLFFVVVLDMNVAGVALATVLSQAVSCVLVLRALCKRTDDCKLFLRKLHIYPSALGRIVRIGLPAGLQGSLFSISNVIIQSSLNSLGNLALEVNPGPINLIIEGNTAAANLEGFVYVSMNAFHQTAMNFMGQNLGARRYENLGTILRYCLFTVAGVGFVFGGLCRLFATPLLSIYLPGDEASIAYGILRLTFVCLPYFTCGLMDVMSGALRGLGASLSPMLITVLGVCGMRLFWIYAIFRPPFNALREQFHAGTIAADACKEGADGLLQSLYISYPVSWVLTFVALLCCFLILRRRLLRKAKANA